MNDKKQIRLWLFGYAKKYWLPIFLVSLFSLLKVGFQLLNPWPIKVLIDSVFGDVPAPWLFARIESPEQLLVAITVALILIYLVQNLLAILNAYVSAMLDLKFDMDVKSGVFKRLLNMSLAALNKKQLGDYLFRLNSETSAIRGLVVGVTKVLLEATIMIIGALTILLLINWQLALLAVVAVPFLYISVRHFSSKIESIASEIEVNTAALYSHSVNSVQNIRTIQAFDQEERQSKILHNLLIDRYKISLRNLLLHGKFGLTNDMISTVAMSALILAGGSAVLQQQLTIGELIIFLTYVSFLFGPLESINASIGRAKEHMAAVKRVYEVVENKNTVQETNNPIHMQRAKGFITFSNIGFKYPGGQPVFEKVNIAIKPGQKIHFIGPSGSGKSSLLNLLPRFYDPTQGLIHIDGREIRALSLKELRQQFSIVSQEAMLIAGTIADNIAFGSSDPGMNKESIEIRAAAEAAGAHDFINKLPKKYDTYVSADSTTLSGGQKQRIAIARAFLKDAPILLLDEPTSALDPEAESEIVETLQKLMKSRTTLVATHREALLKNSDGVYLVKDGRITHLEDPKKYLSTLGPRKASESIFYQYYKD
jgi:ATP-binding cassette, subfamily B, bacterial